MIFFEFIKSFFVRLSSERQRVYPIQQKEKSSSINEEKELIALEETDAEEEFFM